MTEHLPHDLENRILRLLDGELDPEEIHQLDVELQHNKRARALYLQTAALHSALQNHHLSRSDLPRMPLISMERMLARHRRKQVRISLMAAAAVLLISAISLWMIMAPRTPGSLASFAVTSDATFTLTHKPNDDGPQGDNTLRIGSRLQLGHGTMEAKFSSGVRCVIEAPCDLTVLSNDKISMKEGVAWFDVPPAAVGFTVETPQLTIVDLGTRFGVLAEVNAPHEVHVLTGKVEVSPRGQNGIADKLVLQAGQARRVDAKGGLIQTPLDSDRFPTSLPMLAVIRNAGFDSLEKIDTEQDGVGYGPIADWATSGLGVGVSNIHQPFLRQPAHSGTHAAFIQGKGTISQSVSGFNPSKLYTVTYFVSERGLPGAATRTAVSLDLGSSFHTQHDLIRKTDAFRRIVSGPLHVFGPTANIEIRAQTIHGDAALLIDSVKLSRATPTIPDGGFETVVLAPKRFAQAHLPEGESLDTSPWTFRKGAGITINGSAFTPPLAPEGSQAAVLQNPDAAIETTLHGFEPGVTYRLHLQAAGRNDGGGAAGLRVSLDGKPLSFGNSETLNPPIGTYQTFASGEFKPTGDSLNLHIHSTSNGTTFLDDLHFEFLAEAEDNN